MTKPVVEISPGTAVQGKVLFAKDCTKPCYTYLGVPFAQPPIGKLRFRPPKSLELWDGTKDATQCGSICPQPLEASRMAFPRYPVPDKMSEDCLFLNIYTPVSAEGSKGPLLPVMLWIHGGGFLLGSNDIYDSRALASHHDVVVVTINYRLGIFGFLSTPDGHIAGNMGLMDQVEAMKWVQKYICHFGGDPDNVTLFGESAGAISVSMHMVSPLTKGLFKRGICESGTTMYPSIVWSPQNTEKFLKASLRPLGFESTSGPEVEAFLSKMSTTELVNSFSKTFGKTIDGQYLTGHPVDLYRKGQFHSADLLCGFNTHEGLLFINMFIGPTAIQSKAAAKTFIDMSLKQVHFRGYPKANEICDLVAKEYIDDCEEDADALTERCTEVHADVQFTAPTIETAEQHSGKAATYVYEFRHRPFFSTLQAWALSDHTHEIPYVFGEPFVRPQSWPEEDVNMSKIIMCYWTNFAKYGNPNGQNLAQWPRYNTTEKKYLQLNSHPEVARDYKPKKTFLWNNTVMDLTHHHTATAKM